MPPTETRNVPPMERTSNCSGIVISRLCDGRSQLHALVEQARAYPVHVEKWKVKTDKVMLKV